MYYLLSQEKYSDCKSVLYRTVFKATFSRMYSYTSTFISGMEFVVSFTGIMMIALIRYLNIQSNCETVALLGFLMYFIPSFYSLIDATFPTIPVTLMHAIGSSCMLLIPYFRFKDLMTRQGQIISTFMYVAVCIGVLLTYLSGRDYIPNYFAYIGFPIASIFVFAMTTFYAIRIVNNIHKSNTTDTAKLNIKRIFVLSTTTLTIISMFLAVFTFLSTEFFEISIGLALVLLFLLVFGNFAIEFNKIVFKSQAIIELNVFPISQI